MKNHWTKTIQIRTLNKLINEKMKHLVGKEWNDELKQEISQIAFDFMEDNQLNDTFSFAAELEITTTNGNNTKKFRGLRIIP